MRWREPACEVELLWRVPQVLGRVHEHDAGEFLVGYFHDCGRWKLLTLAVCSGASGAVGAVRARFVGLLPVGVDSLRVLWLASLEDVAVVSSTGAPSCCRRRFVVVVV